MEKRIKTFWVAGFFLPAINATVFRISKSLIAEFMKQIKASLFENLHFFLSHQYKIRLQLK